MRTIISLAETLGLRTIAEGVEQREQFDELALLGCDAVQGFLFSRPVIPADMEELLDSDVGLLRSANAA